MSTKPNEMPGKGIKGLGKPLQPSNLMPSKLYLLTCAGAAAFCGFYLKSGILVGMVLGGVVVDILAGVMFKNILFPPFLLPTSPEEGLHQNRALICPYWPEETVQGPKAMKLEFQDVEMPSDEGTVLRGWLIPPQGQGAPDRNTILIMSHGAGRDRRAWLRHTPFLTKAGYTCLMFDFRNHGTSDSFGGGGTFLGLAEWEDMCTAAKWVKSSHPAAKVAFVGTSTGAVASMVAPIQAPWLAKYVKCVVAENPFSSTAALTHFVCVNVGFRVVVCKSNGLLFSLLYPLALLVSLVSNYRVRNHLRKIVPAPVPSALDAADKVPVPMLVMHGTADQIVPPSHSHAIIARCRSGPLAASLRSWICAGAGHCQLWDAAAAEFEAQVLEFLDRHCQ